MILASTDVSSFAETVGVPLTVALIGVAATLAAAAMSFALARWGEATNRRRDAYASAVRVLVSYAEYPFRIRRRASDEADELSRIAAIGHELQEALRFHETWVSSEDRWVGRIFREVREDLASIVASWARDAWAGPPIRSAQEMNLGEWGPTDCDQYTARFEAAIACRFGWRRIPSSIGWRVGAKQRST